MEEFIIEGYFTIIETEILDLLPILKLTARELRCMIVMVRLTNGFKKSGDRIPLSQFFTLTRMAKGHGSSTITKLIEKKLIYRNGNLLGINKDFSQWEGVTKLVTLKGLPNWFKKVTKLGNKKVTILDPSKETSKETTKERVFSKIKDEEQKELNLKMIREFVKGVKSIPKK